MHPLLRAAAERQHGVFTAAQAVRAGHGHDEIRVLVASGAWVRLRRGVYTTAEQHAAHGRADHATACWAALLVLDRPTAVVSHSSAARLHGLPMWTGLDRTVRLTDPTLWRIGRGFRVNAADLGGAEVTRVGRLPVTSAARTLVDCAREWDLDDSVVAMDAALLAGAVTRDKLRTALAGQYCWPGTPRARRAVALADGRAESPLETRGRLRLVGAGLPPNDLQVEVPVGARMVAVADAWYEEAAVAVEFDGRVKYTDPWRGQDPRRVLWDEKRREDELRSLDIRVVRIADADLGASWPLVEERIQRLVAVPGPADRRFSAIPRRRGIRRSA